MECPPEHEFCTHSGGVSKHFVCINFFVIFFRLAIYYIKISKLKNLLAFGHPLRSAVVTPLFCWFPKNNGQTVAEKFERYMTMGHIWANLYIYIYICLQQINYGILTEHSVYWFYNNRDEILSLRLTSYWLMDMWISCVLMMAMTLHIDRSIIWYIILMKKGSRINTKSSVTGLLIFRSKLYTWF